MFFLCLHLNIEIIVRKFITLACKLASTLMDPNIKLVKNDGRCILQLESAHTTSILHLNTFFSHPSFTSEQ